MGTSHVDCKSATRYMEESTTSGRRRGRKRSPYRIKTKRILTSANLRAVSVKAADDSF
jgi:hypothetical protein